jgi:hypothetical protein
VNIFLTFQHRNILCEVNISLEEFRRQNFLRNLQVVSHFYKILHQYYTSKCCVFLKDLCFYATEARTLDRTSDFLTSKFRSVSDLVRGFKKRQSSF